MRQTKGGLKNAINSFGVARDSSRRADELLSALDSQFYGLKPLVAWKAKIRTPSRTSGRPQQVRKCSCD